MLIPEDIMVDAVDARQARRVLPAYKNTLQMQSRGVQQQRDLQ